MKTISDFCTSMGKLTPAFICPLCSSDRLKRIPFRYRFKDRFLWGMRCNDCGLISIFPRPEPEEIREMYVADYFTGADGQTHHMTRDYLSATAVADNTSMIEFIKKHKDHGKFLEIGCATGAFLHRLQNHGFEVRGVEISEFAAGYGREKFGIDIISKPFSEDLIGHELHENEFDIVFMGDILEHLTQPLEALQIIHRILKPDGVVITKVPGTLNLISTRLAFTLYRLTGNQKTMTIPPYHLTEFMPRTLDRMFHQAGFSKVKIDQSTKHPKTITLRHSMLENMIKLAFQYPNYYLTRWFGVLGDRMMAVAGK
ncbi:MAG: methyltransferase domain-containing protein [Bacteroidetes bacterium]|nr:methyltransferase domain-containing protein [Bacteroidota bacterium]